MTRPLVVYCTFGASYVRMMQLSLWSLFDTGAYEGEVLIISNLSRDELAKTAPLVAHPRVKVVEVPIESALTAKVARYQIHRVFDTTDYAPILYVDCDIVFDRPIAPMLAAVAGATKLCFPAELDSQASWGSMGNDLLKDEGLSCPSGHGFNSGTLGIPDGRKFSYFIELERIAETVVRLTNEKPHLFTRWVDQPVVNYLHAKHGCFDTQVLTPFFRFFFGEPWPVSHGLGGAHFFDDGKEERMLRYLATFGSPLLFEVGVGIRGTSA